MDIKQALFDEIRRLARKEIKAALIPLQNTISSLKKQVAEQKKLKAETDKETAITNAQAEAETIRIKANAEAEANRILSESLDEIILEYSKIEKWDGKLPQVLTGDSGNLLIDVPAAD